MSLKLIYEERDIRAAQRELVRGLQHQLPSLGRQSVTFRPTWVDMNIRGKGQDRLYFGTRLVSEDKKFWNAFGVFDRLRQRQEITVEINFSVGGGRTAGMLAQDENGRRFVLHSGGIGGGKKGVTQEAFLAWLKPEPVLVEAPGNDLREAILIGELGAKNLSDRIESFVRAVRAFKDAVKDGILETPDFEDQVERWREYRREFSGRKVASVHRDIDYVAYHGDIVEALKDWFEARVSGNEQVTNSPLIDLLVHRNGALIRVCEVKTRASRQALYTAIGQLIVHASADDVARTIVLPHKENLRGDIAAALARSKIEIIRFAIDDNDKVSIV